MAHNILVINPGSTSDDIGYYRGNKAVFEVTVRYSMTDLEPYENQNVTAQLPLRRKLILDYLLDHKIQLKEIDAVIGRGGLLHALEGGVYAVNEKMIQDLTVGRYGNHASNLGGILARDIAKYAGCPSYIANPVIVDEFEPVARLSGMPDNPRISIFHALSQKRVARLIASKRGKLYEDVNCIVCHGGGGVSVGAHRKGRVIDVTNGFEGDGPMTPQRSGSTPGLKLVQALINQKGGHERSKIVDFIVGNGYEKAFAKEHTPHAWTNSDPEEVRIFNEDPLCGYTFTLNGYENLIKLAMLTYRDGGYGMRNPELPIRFYSGGDDPCAISREKLGEAIKLLRKQGYKNSKGKIYPGMRHEILREREKEKVWADILNFLEDGAAGASSDTEEKSSDEDND